MVHRAVVHRCLLGACRPAVVGRGGTAVKAPPRGSLRCGPPTARERSHDRPDGTVATSATFVASGLGGVAVRAVGRGVTAPSPRDRRDGPPGRAPFGESGRQTD